MLKNLASLGTAGAVQSGASRIILNMRPRTLSCPKSLMHTFSNAPFSIRSAPPDRNNKYGIDNRRHCMGPSVDLFEPESHIRRLRFTGKCPRLTVEKNISNPSIAQSSRLEIRPNRPASCPQKLISHITSLKLPGNVEKLYSKDTLVRSLLKSKLSNGYANTAKSERSTSEAPKTFSTSMSSRPTSKSAERGSMNRFSFQNILKPKQPISSAPRMIKINQSSSCIQKPALKTNQNNDKPEEKGLNWHFGSHRRVSSFERKNGELCKISDFADKGKVSLSNMKRPQTVNSRNMPKPFSAQSGIRSSCNRISSLSQLQKSSATVVVPCWRATNTSNVTNTNRLARPSRSVTGASSGLWSDKTPEKSVRSTSSHPFETESSPNVFDKKTFPRYTPMNNVESNTENSELITLLEPQSTSKGWRGNTKTRIEKLPFKKPKPQHDLESSNVNNQVARPHTSSPKFHVFTRTETNKLHPGTMNANKQIAMIYKDKFDPALLDRFRYRNVTANKYSKPSNYKAMTSQASSTTRPTTSSFAKTSPLAKRQSFTSSAVVKALEIRNNLNFMKKAPTFSPGGRRDSFVVRPVTTTRHAQSASGWVPFIRPPLVSTKPKTDKGFHNLESQENIDKSASIPNRRPLRQWKEKAEKWTDSVSRRPEREPRGRYDKFSISSFKHKASEKLEVPNTSKTDNGVGSSVGGGRDGRKNIPLTEKASTSLRNVASQVWSSWHGLRRKIQSGYIIALRATSPMLRIPPMLPDHLRYGLSKED